jgi:hypothetical protein
VLVNDDASSLDTVRVAHHHQTRIGIASHVMITRQLSHVAGRFGLRHFISVMPLVSFSTLPLLPGRASFPLRGHVSCVYNPLLELRRVPIARLSFESTVPSSAVDRY